MPSWNHLSGAMGTSEGSNLTRVRKKSGQGKNPREGTSKLLLSLKDDRASAEGKGVLGKAPRNEEKQRSKVPEQ